MFSCLWAKLDPFITLISILFGICDQTMPMAGSQCSAYALNIRSSVAPRRSAI